MNIGLVISILVKGYLLFFLQTSLSYSYPVFCGHGPGALRELISLPPIGRIKKNKLD